MRFYIYFLQALKKNEFFDIIIIINANLKGTAV